MTAIAFSFVLQTAKFKFTYSRRGVSLSLSQHNLPHRVIVEQNVIKEESHIHCVELQRKRQEINAMMLINNLVSF